MKSEGKYQPLFTFLSGQKERAVSLTFAEIEALLGSNLPASARTSRAWWSNRKKGALQARAWMEAGYRAVNVNLESTRVTFRRPMGKYDVGAKRPIEHWDGEAIEALRRHMEMTQAEFAERLGVRQQTVSEWETGAYLPKRSTSKHLSLVAEQVDFGYGEEEEEDELEDELEDEEEKEIGEE